MANLLSNMKKIALAGLALALLASSASAQIDRSRPPAPAEPPVVRLGKPQEFALDNGLRVLLVENHDRPVASFSLSLDIDPVNEGDKAGYVNMVGELMKAGTTSRDKARLDADIDFIGARVSAYSSGMYGFSLTKHTERMLELMADVLLNPSFPEAELEKLRTQALSSLSASKTNANSIASNVSSVLMYGSAHPYGEVPTEESLARIGVEDCKAYYQTYFRPNVASLVITGDLTLEQAKALVQKHFGSWQAAPVPEHEHALPPAIRGVRVAVVDRPQAVQSLITVCYPVEFHPADPDVLAGRLMNAILGGGVFSGRLMQNLREDKAYTYGARSDLSTSELVGRFSASAQVRNEVTDSAVAQFLLEMRRMETEPPTAEDLALVKSVYSGNFARSLEDPENIARYALNIARYGLPADYYETYLRRVEAVSLDDVARMTGRFLRPDDCLVLVVGKASAIEQGLAALDSDGKIEYFDLYGQAVEPAAADLPLPEGLDAETVMERYIEAIGGRRALARLKHETLRMTAQVQGAEMEIKLWHSAPNLLRTETLFNGMSMQSQTFDGTRGREEGMMGRRELEGQELDLLREEAVFHPELRWKELGYQLELTRAVQLEQGPAYEMAISLPTGEQIFYYFDSQTHLRVRKRETHTAEGGPVEVVADYSDYRAVNGVRYPFLLRQQVGEQTLEMRVQDIDNKTKIDKKNFMID